MKKMYLICTAILFPLINPLVAAQQDIFFALVKKEWYKEYKYKPSDIKLTSQIKIDFGRICYRLSAMYDSERENDRLWVNIDRQYKNNETTIIMCVITALFLQSFSFEYLSLPCIYTAYQRINPLLIQTLYEKYGNKMIIMLMNDELEQHIN